MLSQSPFVQVAVKALQIPRIANAVLGVLPLSRPLNGGRLRYRIRYFDSFVLAQGIFSGDEYGCIQPDVAQIHSFVDLGCNVGYFPLFLCQQRGDNDIHGICFDANAHMVAEASKNLALNGLDRVTVEHGLVASGPAGEQQDFWIAQNSMSSTANPDLLGSRFGVRKARVTTVDPFLAFSQHFGSQRIDLLKIDIEGCEFDLLRENPRLVDASERIILEFHKPKVTLDMVKQLLVSAGFRVKYTQDPVHLPWGIAYFAR